LSVITCTGDGAGVLVQALIPTTTAEVSARADSQGR
jgi:hypothetical protein